MRQNIYHNDSEKEDSDIDKENSNPRGLNHLIKFLKRNKLICNVKKYENPENTSYDDLCKKAEGILKEDSSNKVYLCHMTQTKRYVLEQNDGIEPQLKNEPKKRVALKSEFECKMTYEFTMCSVYTPEVLTIEDIMIMQKHSWTTEIHKLLEPFHNNNIWNKFDLLDKQLIHRLKLKL
eukprot:201157_1